VNEHPPYHIDIKKDGGMTVQAVRRQHSIGNRMGSIGRALDRLCNNITFVHTTNESMVKFIYGGRFYIDLSGWCNEILGDDHWSWLKSTDMGGQRYTFYFDNAEDSCCFD
jgi:hypothetical protein